MYDIFASILNDFNNFCKEADEFIEKQKEYEKELNKLNTSK